MQTTPSSNRHVQAAGLADSQPREAIGLPNRPTVAQSINALYERGEQMRRQERERMEQRYQYAVYSYFAGNAINPAPQQPAPPPPAVSGSNEVPNPRGWNKVETTSASERVEPPKQLTPNQRALLYNYIGAYMPKEYVEWGLNFFGVEEVAKYLTSDAIRRGYPDFHGPISRGSATGFTACCGYAEMHVSGIGYAKLWKQHLCFAWLARKAGVICTINWEQQNCLEPLQKLGFNIVDAWRFNPNSGNKIMMLLYTFPQGDELTSA